MEEESPKGGFNPSQLSVVRRQILALMKDYKTGAEFIRHWLRFKKDQNNIGTSLLDFWLSGS